MAMNIDSLEIGKKKRSHRHNFKITFSRKALQQGLANTLQRWPPQQNYLLNPFHSQAASGRKEIIRPARQRHCKYSETGKNYRAGGYV